MAKQVFYNNTEANDDWMKALPGYKNEIAIHDQLAADYAKSKKGKLGSRRVKPRWQPKSG